MKKNNPPPIEGNKPAHEIRVSGIRATIWKNEAEKGAFFNTVFERSYREGDEWKSSDSFGRDDLLVVSHLASECFRWITQQPTMR